MILAYAKKLHLHKMVEHRMKRKNCVPLSVGVGVAVWIVLMHKMSVVWTIYQSKDWMKKFGIEREIERERPKYTHW